MDHKLSTTAPNSLRFDGASDSPRTPMTSSSSTLPRFNIKSRPTLSNTLRARTSVDSTQTRKSLSSLHSPDRFLPVLKRSDSAAQSFRANKDPGTLSPYERLMRNSSASLDAFNPRRRATSPIPLASRPDSRRIVSANRGRGKQYLTAISDPCSNHSTGATALTFQRNAPTTPNGERQVRLGLDSVSIYSSQPIQSIVRKDAKFDIVTLSFLVLITTGQCRNCMGCRRSGSRERWHSRWSRWFVG
ncbi:hypothetical protein OCU04_011443 [Sclerotinia nivalis]|uniref:Uncharacterized protein n=1 Tax=Sclerotinia nivalis TaxID=352851 RepID=A0A9X0ABQ9_9HELO|nr:hypothetical protein OCU04_011443 [Sclerotinia nivalis]